VTSPSRTWISLPRTLPVIGLLSAAAVLLVGAPAGAQERTVLVTQVRAVITPVVADHLGEAVEVAERDGHVGLLVELDTPGGLDASMRDIIQAFLGARVPVIVYVAPAGARAASAGALITMSAHVAAMTPGTAIGAATPVDLQGGDIERKVIEDAAAYAEEIARVRGRDAEFAVAAVRQGRSVTAARAAEIGAVDLLARNRSELLRDIDGTTVQLADGTRVTLETGDATTVDYGMSFSRRVLQWLADPNIAFLLLSLGTLAIIYELANPGIGGGGIVGAIFLILGFFSLAVLPVTALGGILLLLAIGLFAAEIFTPGVGVFAAGGTVSLILGGLFLFRGGVGVDLTVLLPVALVVGGGVLVAGRLAWRTRRLPGSTGTGAVVGHRGTVKGVQGDRAQVVVQGVWWGARSTGPQLREGQRVRVVEMDGLELVVEPEEGQQERPEEQEVST
jgi:membrane-bound serine protease (ClpP class)